MYQNRLTAFRIASRFETNKALLALCVLAAVVAGWFSFWTDSEMWAVAVSRYLFSNLNEYDFRIKPAFSLVLYLNFQVAAFLDVHPMLTARAFFALNLLIAVWLFFAITRRFEKSRSTTVLLLLVLVTNSFFIKRFGQVRSDVLASTLTLLFIWLTQNGAWEKWSLQIRLAFALLFAGLMTAIAAKFLPVILAWSFLVLPRGGEKGRKIGISLGFAAIFLALIFRRDLALFLNMFPAENMGHSYFDPQRIEHLLRWLLENPLLLPALAYNMYLTLCPPSDLSRAQRNFFQFSGFCLLYLALFPDRLHFFIAALTPLLMLPLSISVHRIKLSRGFTFLVIAFCGFSAAYWTLISVQRHNFREQLRYSEWASEYVNSSPALSIYDPVGIVPFSNAYNWFLGPADDTHRNVLINIETKKPDIVFYVKKSEILEPALSELLRAHYKDDGLGLFVRAVRPDLKALADMSLTAEELQHIFEKEFPRFVQLPDQPLFIHMMSKDNVYLTRYARTISAGGGVSNFSGSITFSELAKIWELKIPPGVREVYVIPSNAATPFNTSWSEAFRFDPNF